MLPHAERCRTCFKTFVENEISFAISSKSKEPCQITLKEMIINCVPELILSEKTDEEICSSCNYMLDLAYKFRTTCLKAECNFNAIKIKREPIDVDEAPKDNEFSISAETTTNPFAFSFKISNKEPKSASNTCEFSFTSGINSNKNNALKPIENNAKTLSNLQNNLKKALNNPVKTFPVVIHKVQEVSSNSSVVTKAQQKMFYTINENKNVTSIEKTETVLCKISQVVGGANAEENSLNQDYNVNIQEINKAPKEIDSNKQNETNVDANESFNPTHAYESGGLDINPKIEPVFDEIDDEMDVVDNEEDSFQVPTFNAFNMIKRPRMDASTQLELSIIENIEVLSHTIEVNEDLQQFTPQDFLCTVKLERVDVPAIKKKTQYICKHCGAQLCNTNKLMSHIRRHHNNRPFKCTLCERSFFEEHELRKHIIAHKMQNKRIQNITRKKIINIKKTIKKTETKMGRTWDMKGFENIIPSRLRVKKVTTYEEPADADEEDDDKEEVNVYTFSKVKKLGHFNTIKDESIDALHCRICMISFKTHNAGIWHFKNHCPICFKYFNSDDLKKHSHKSLKIKGKPRRYHCHPCNAFLLQKHFFSHILRKKCALCDMQINPRFLRSHMRTYHKESYVEPVIEKALDIADEKIFPCRGCTQIFRSYRPRWRHERKYNHAPQFKCRGCKYTFINERLRRTHENKYSHQPLEDRPILFTCRGCEMTFGTYKSRYAHEQKYEHNLNKQQTQKAPLIIELIKEEEVKVQHNQFPCRGCKLAFRTYKNRWDHEKKFNHRPKKGTHTHACTNCNDAFASLVLLKEHNCQVFLPVVASDDIKCDVCLNTYNNLAYEEHVCIDANGERFYKCHICKLSFPRLNFVEHIKVHINNT